MCTHHLLLRRIIFGQVRKRRQRRQRVLRHESAAVLRVPRHVGGALVATLAAAAGGGGFVDSVVLRAHQMGLIPFRRRIVGFRFGSGSPRAPQKDGEQALENRREDDGVCLRQQRRVDGIGVDAVQCDVFVRSCRVLHDNRSELSQHDDCEENGVVSPLANNAFQ